MAEEKNVASAAKPEQVDCLELVKKLADSYRCLIRRRELLRQQYEESKSWFYTKEECSLGWVFLAPYCQELFLTVGYRQAACRTQWNARSLIAIRCWHP